MDRQSHHIIFFIATLFLGVTTACANDTLIPAKPNYEQSLPKDQMPHNIAQIVLGIQKRLLIWTGDAHRKRSTTSQKLFFTKLTKDKTSDTPEVIDETGNGYQGIRLATNHWGTSLLLSKKAFLPNAGISSHIQYLIVYWIIDKQAHLLNKQYKVLDINTHSVDLAASGDKYAIALAQYYSSDNSNKPPYGDYSNRIVLRFLLSNGFWLRNSDIEVVEAKPNLYQGWPKVAASEHNVMIVWQHQKPKQSMQLSYAVYDSQSGATVLIPTRLGVSIEPQSHQVYYLPTIKRFLLIGYFKQCEPLDRNNECQHQLESGQTYAMLFDSLGQLIARKTLPTKVVNNSKPLIFPGQVSELPYDSKVMVRIPTQKGFLDLSLRSDSITSATNQLVDKANNRMGTLMAGNRDNPEFINLLQTQK